MEVDVHALIDTYFLDVFRFIRVHTPDSLEAEDLTQEVFTRAFSHRESLAHVVNVKAWLLRVAVNLCRDSARQRRRRVVSYVSDPPDIQSTPGAEEMVLRAENARNVLQLVMALPEKWKEVILLHYLEECSVADISWMLGIPENTVKTRLHRARQRLRKEGGVHRDDTW